MDKFNVISLTSDLTELQNDMYMWLNMPYDRRMRSDEDCIRLYGITNTELFNQLKASILSNKIPEDPELIGNAITEGSLIHSDHTGLAPDFDFLTFIWKKQIAQQLEQSPYIVIISPFYKNQIDMTMTELLEKYNKYSMLSDKNKRFSNSYSTDLWGYSVPNMYEIMKRKLQEESNEDVLPIGSNLTYRSDTFMDNLKEHCDSMLVEDDKLGLYRVKLDACAEMGSYYSTIYNSLVSEIDKSITDCYNYSDILSTMTPYFTPSEMNSIGSNQIIDLNNASYYSTIKELMEKYKNGNSELEQSILDLGWNPSVPLTEDNIKFARNRQLNWLKEHSACIVDITKVKIPECIVNESTSNMRKIYKERDLYPVYIVLSHSKTLFGKIINKVKNSTYSHAGLSLDSDMKNITTYKCNKYINGFATDSLDTYISESKEAILTVLVFFVDEKTKFKIDAVMKDFVQKQEKTKYGFGNLFNILLGKEKNTPENLSLVCSQFVDVVLKLANINLVDKPSNLVIPEDFVQVATHPKVFKVYEGLATKYNERKVEDLIFNLFDTYTVRDIKYMELMDQITESFELNLLSTITENKKANKILNEMRDLLTPEAVIYERKAPIKFNDKGDLSINFSKTFEDEYQESHKLLTSYSKNNAEAIKHELARLFFINSSIEKKIKKMKKDDSQYKILIDLRARVLNDFKKYLKIILESEPDFNFGDYFKSSEYYDANIIIDNSTLKFSGSLIKKFIKSLFVN